MGGFANNAPIVTDGLVFYVDAGNDNSYPGSGTTWSDLIGGNNGTLANGPTYSSANGGSIVFDGSDDEVSGFSSLNLVTSNNNDKFTLCAFVKIDSFKDYSGIVHLQSQVGMFTSSDGGFSIQSDGDNAGASPANTQINDGGWHYICTSYEERVEYKGWKDGQLVFTVSTGNSENPDAGQTVNIGGGMGTPTETDGQIALVQIYNKVLNDSEVLQNYNALKNRFV
jgi:hypothetical protein